MKKVIQLIVGVVSLIIALFILFKISLSVDFAIRFLIISFGLLAVIWAFKAYKNLAPNSSLKSYSFIFALAITLVIINEIILVLASFLVLSKIYYYIAYGIVIIGYFLLAVSAYKILRIGEEFGFSESRQIISKALKEKLNKKR